MLVRISQVATAAHTRSVQPIESCSAIFTTNNANHLMVLLKKHSTRHSLARILIGYYNNVRSHRTVSTAPNILSETLL